MSIRQAAEKLIDLESKHRNVSDDPKWESAFANLRAALSEVEPGLEGIAADVMRSVFVPQTTSDSDCSLLPAYKYVLTALTQAVEVQREADAKLVEARALRLRLTAIDIGNKQAAAETLNCAQAIRNQERKP